MQDLVIAVENLVSKLDQIDGTLHLIANAIAPGTVYGR